MSSVRRVNAGRRLGVFAWLLGLALAGCVTYPKPTAPVTLPAGAAATRAAASSPAEYRLRVHDELDVKFFHNPELNESLVVRPDGRISLQLIGDIPAAGLTPSQLQRNVLKRYTPILRYPEPTVIV